MTTLAEQITSELRVLIGQPLSDCWRVVNMQIFEFGMQHPLINDVGEKIHLSNLRLHIQCHWRFVDSEHILFACDDLYCPADSSVAVDQFDWDQQESLLDAKQGSWFDLYRGAPLRVSNAYGDQYGGFRIEIEGAFALECLPCQSRWETYSEHWRLLGHQADDSHFVVTTQGVQATVADIVEDN